MTASPTYMGGCFLNANLSSFNGTSQMIFNGDRRSGNNQTEANAQLRIRAAGTLSRLGANAAVNGSNPSGSTIRLRVNGGNVNQVISITGNTTGQFQDLTHSDSIASGDQVCTSLVVTGSGAGFTLGPFGYTFTGTTVVASMLGCVGGASVAASSTNFFPFMGSDSNTPGIFATSENDQVKFPIRSAQTFSNMQIRVGSNTSTNAVTVTVRKTGADGNNTVSLTAGATGNFEDTTHTDAYAATDNICGKWVTGAGTSNTTIVSLGGMMTSGATKFDLGSSLTYSSSTNQLPTATASFDPIHGTMKVGHSVTEADTQIKFPFGANFSKMRVSVSASGSMSGPVAMTFRQNGADAAQTVSITANTTGVFEDTTHSDLCAQDDLVNVKFAAAVAGQCVVSKIGITADGATSVTYNDSVTETGTAATAQDSIGTYGATDTEAATATDLTYPDGSFYTAINTASATALDVVSGIGDESTGETEAATAADAVSVGLVTVASDAEAVTASEIVSAGLQYSVTATEAATATDSSNSFLIGFGHGEVVNIIG